MPPRPSPIAVARRIAEQSGMNSVAVPAKSWPVSESRPMSDGPVTESWPVPHSGPMRRPVAWLVRRAVSRRRRPMARVGWPMAGNPRPMSGNAGSMSGTPWPMTGAWPGGRWPMGRASAGLGVCGPVRRRLGLSRGLGGGNGGHGEDQAADGDQKLLHGQAPGAYRLNPQLSFGFRQP